MPCVPYICPFNPLQYALHLCANPLHRADKKTPPQKKKKCMPYIHAPYLRRRRQREDTWRLSWRMGSRTSICRHHSGRPRSRGTMASTSILQTPRTSSSALRSIAFSFALTFLGCTWAVSTPVVGLVALEGLLKLLETWEPRTVGQAPSEAPVYRSFIFRCAGRQSEAPRSLGVSRLR